jgi:phosphatidate cytidylyltransferase
MLSTRILSAIVAILIIVPILLWGGVFGVTMLVLVLASLGVWELSDKLSAVKTQPSRYLLMGANCVFLIAAALLPLRAAPPLIVALPLVALFFHLLLFNVIEDTINSVSQSIFILAYVTVPLGHAILLDRLPWGSAWVFLVLIVISLGDAGAYFAGRYLGTHHFSKHVSPKKTIEGLAGGVAGNFLGMFIAKLCCPDMAPLKLLVYMTLVMALVGPIGDLMASALKRRLGIKDFGSVMPGHGGLLDRADSLIPSFPAVYYILVLAGSTVAE